jgi:predicted short-subunit dehydrogenase-like oxidoreductase (DUF2520 family)
MQAKPDIAIVGPGSLGSALALSLARSGWPVESIVARGRGRSLEKARALARRVKARAAVVGEEVRAEVIWFCVPDSEISSTAQLFASTGSWKGRVALHSSGARSSDDLNSLRRRGAAVASVHPLMTFVGRSSPGLTGVPFAIEGDRAAVHIVRGIVTQLGGSAYSIRKQDKPAYHAWGTFASPLLTALLATTEKVASLAGVRGEAARQRMIPILSRSLANYAEFGAARGFSGPIIRGDVETVKQHLRILRRDPALREVYLALARAALRYLPAKNKDGLEALLSSKG